MSKRFSRKVSIFINYHYCIVVCTLLHVIFFKSYRITLWNGAERVVDVEVRFSAGKLIVHKLTSDAGARCTRLGNFAVRDVAEDRRRGRRRRRCIRDSRERRARRSVNFNTQHRAVCVFFFFFPTIECTSTGCSRAIARTFCPRPP